MEITAQTVAAEKALAPILAQARKAGLPIQGTIKRGIVVIAPPWIAPQRSGLVWSSNSAIHFSRYLTGLGFGDLNEYLVVPSCMEAKPKLNNMVARPYYTKLADLAQVRGFICIGFTTFKFALGLGSAPSTDMLFGAELYTRFTGSKPVFVAPFFDVLDLSEEVVNGDYKYVGILRGYAHQETKLAAKLRPWLTRILA